MRLFRTPHAHPLYFRLPRRYFKALFQLSERPYPVDRQIAAFIKADHKNHVISYGRLLSDYIPQWVKKSLLAAGRQTVSNRDVDSDRFQLSGIHGIADAEFLARCNDVLEYCKRMVTACDIRTGSTVQLYSMPLNSRWLGYAALLDGTWIDAAAIALAELGRKLRKAQFEIDTPLDLHALAWSRVFPPDTDWSAPVLTRWRDVQPLRDQARKRINSFGATTTTDQKHVNGRLFINYRRNARWRENIFRESESGILLRSWNAHLASNHARRQPAVTPDGVSIHEIVYGRNEPLQEYGLNLTNVVICSDNNLGNALDERWMSFERLVFDALSEYRDRKDPPRFEDTILIWNKQRCDFRRAPDAYHFMRVLVNALGKPVEYDDLYREVYGYNSKRDLGGQPETFNEAAARIRIRQLKARTCKRLRANGLSELADGITGTDQSYILSLES